MPARKLGTKHVIDEADLRALSGSATVPLPAEWQKTSWGGPMPDVVAAVHRCQLHQTAGRRRVDDEIRASVTDSRPLDL